MHWHWQNLNEDRHGNKGPRWRHGRAWFHFTHRVVFGIEWVAGRRAGFAIEFDYGDGDGCDAIDVRLGIPCVLKLYLSFDGVIPRRFRLAGYEARATGISRFDGTWHIQLWNPTMSWDSKKRKSSWMFSFADLILGKRRYSSVDLTEPVPVVVPMPERTYAGTVRLFRSTWRRPRWPSAVSIDRADIDVPDGIPVPGKGENSWDCGEDATFSLTTPAKTVPEAIGAMVEDCLRTRERHGGSVGWLPGSIRADMGGVRHG